MKKLLWLTVPLIGIAAAIWFMRPRGIVPLSSDEAIALVRAIAEGRSSGSLGTLGRPFDTRGEATIIVSAPRGNQTVRPQIVRAESWQDAALGAAALLKAAGSESLAIRLDLVVKTLAPITRNSTWSDTIFPYDRSLVGIAPLGMSGPLFLPIQNVTLTLINSKDELRPQNLAKHLDDAEAAVFKERTELTPFITAAYSIDPTGVSEIFRGHRIQPINPPADSLERAIELADSYLLKEIDADGRFTYSYLPKSDQPKSSYNILRHAGTTWALLQAYERSQKPAALAIIKRALGYMVAVTVACPKTKIGALCLLEKGSVKIGANGLALLAFSKYEQLTGDRSFRAKLRGYALRLLEVQSALGEFTRHKETYPEGRDEGFISGYYPGEAIYGLTALYRIDGDRRWLQSAAKAARWQATVRDKDKPIAKLEHDHWFLYGLDALHSIEPDEVYVSQTRKIVQAIIESQNDGSRAPDYDGSWYDEPRSTPAATRSEGLMAAFNLFQRIGDAEWANKALDATRRAIRYQLATQISPEIAMYLPSPPRALGGFRKSFDNFEVRIDYVQHNISALLYYLAAIAAP